MAKKKSARPDSERRRRQSQRLARSLRILELIQGRAKWNLKTLSEELSCSERTVRRDLDALELAGVPYYREGTDNSIRVRSGYRFPVVNLSPDEAIGLAMANSITAAAGLDVGPGSRPATDKILTSSSEEMAQLLSDADQLVSVLGLNLADHSQHREFIRTAQWSLLKKKQLTGQYQSPYEAKSVKLTLHPYRLCLIRQAWYLVASPISGTSPKTYRIARFQSLRMTDAAAIVPDAFDLKQYLGDAWTVYRGETTYEIRIEFSKDAAPLVRETVWHHSQRIEQGHEGSAVVTFKVAGLNEILWWVLSWSGRVKVLSPPELREMVVAQLEAAVEMNRSGKS